MGFKDQLKEAVGDRIDGDYLEARYGAMIVSDVAGVVEVTTPGGLKLSGDGEAVARMLAGHIVDSTPDKFKGAAQGGGQGSSQGGGNVYDQIRQRVKDQSQKGREVSEAARRRRAYLLGEEYDPVQEGRAMAARQKARPDDLAFR